MPRTGFQHLAEVSPDPIRVTSAIENAENDGLTIQNPVVNGVRKAFREHPMETVFHSMNSPIEAERINIRKRLSRK